MQAVTNKLKNTNPLMSTNILASRASDQARPCSNHILTARGAAQMTEIGKQLALLLARRWKLNKASPVQIK